MGHFHTFLFFFFHFLNHANIQRKKNRWYGFITEKNSSFHQNVFQLMCEKKINFLCFTLFRGGGGSGPKVWNFTLFFLFFEWDLPLDYWIDYWTDYQIGCRIDYQIDYRIDYQIDYWILYCIDFHIDYRIDILHLLHRLWHMLLNRLLNRLLNKTIE